VFARIILVHRCAGLLTLRGLALCVVGLMFPGPLAETRALGSLADLRWKHRVFLVDDATERTVSALAARRDAIDERYIIWFCVVSGKLRSNYQGEVKDAFLDHLRQDYFEKTGFPVLLVGKDGGIKSRSMSLDIHDYLLQIDGMPMRQAEMGRQAPH
jgi:hypothetical protein